MGWIGNSSDTGRGGRWGGGPRLGDLEYAGLESKISFALLGSGHCGDGVNALPVFLLSGGLNLCCGWDRCGGGLEYCETSWFGRWGSPTIRDRPGCSLCLCAACNLSRAALTEPPLLASLSSSSDVP